MSMIDRLAQIVGSADQSEVEEPSGQEPAEQVVGLVSCERFAGRTVFHEFNAIEVASATNFANNR